jgi:hypothetical protein
MFLSKLPSLCSVTPYHASSLARTISRRTLNSKALVHSRFSRCDISGAQTGTGTAFSPSPLAFLCQYISTIVAVWHHLAGMELLMSSSYMVPLRCSCCCNSREHFLDLREFLRVIELLRAVQENSLIYSKQKTMLHRQYPNWNLYSVLGNSKGRSYVRVTQAAAWDRSAALEVGIKTLSAKTCTSPPTFSNHT